MACAAEVADFQARIFALEQALALERSSHVEHLREIAAAAGLREVQAAGLLASQGSESTPNGGGPPSPTDSEGSSTGGAPPPGAQEPARSAPATPVTRKSKADAWVERAKKANAGVPTLSSGSSASSSTSVQETSAGSSPGAASGKMARWLNRVQGEPAGTPTPPQAASKVNRWLARQGKPPASNGSAASSWGGGSVTNPLTPDHDTSIEEEQRLLSRIKDAWAKLDGVIHLVGNLQNRDKGHDVAKGRSCGTGETVCQKCGAQQPGSPRPTSAHEHWVGGSGGGGTQMGLRMEAKSRGLTVTHVVPGGQADQAGLEVKDVIKLVNGQKVSSLKVFGKMCQVSGDVVMLEVIRGTGPQHKSMTLYSRTRPPSPSKGGEEAGEEGERDGGVMTQEELAEAYNKQRAADGERAGQGQGRGQAALNVKKKKNTVFNRYGKDTQLWVPDSDESGALVAAATGDGPNSKKGGSGGEPGGFFMFPPGHPDYVPLPPGEAALIAGRQHIHSDERLAPHWSHIIFRSPTGAEIRAQARHATYGTIARVSGPLVNADPITAHTDLANADAINGCVAYIKRGGAPFTKKARVAVAAGACACVVANHDKETFGMSYTDDGLPFDALNIPCVMISAEIAEKLEGGMEWEVTLTPVKPETITKKVSKEAAPQSQQASPPEQESSPPPVSATPGSEGSSAKANGLRGLETLPVDIKQACGVPPGKPGKKPTMWKKIKLLLP